MKTGPTSLQGLKSPTHRAQVKIQLPGANKRVECVPVGKLKHRETKWPCDVTVQDEVITAKSQESLGLVRARVPGEIKHVILSLVPWESRLLTKKYLKAQVALWLITLGKSGNKVGKDVFRGQSAICRDVDQVKQTGRFRELHTSEVMALDISSVSPYSKP